MGDVQYEEMFTNALAAECRSKDHQIQRQSDELRMLRAELAVRHTPELFDARLRNENANLQKQLDAMAITSKNMIEALEIELKELRARKDEE